VKSKKGSNGQDSQSQDDDDDEKDLEGSESSSDDDQNDEDEDDDQEEAGSGSESSSEDKGSPLDKLPKETKDELVRLRSENKRRREANRTLREQLAAATDSRKGKPTADDLEKENSVLRNQVLSLTVGGELRDYLADKHPQYLKLSKRIARFVDLEDVDLTDSDSVQDAVSAAVEEFVKEVPIAPEKKRDDDDEDEDSRRVVDQTGRPVGSASGRPARKSASDKSGADRRKTMFPGIYSGPKA